MTIQIHSTPPRSVRDNNPGNITYGLPWEGLDNPAVDSGGFARFQTPVWGFRAMCRSYMTKFDQQGINTIRKLIEQWSPPNAPGNTPESTNAYIAAVSKSSGYGPDDALPLKTWDCCKRIAYAQAAFEAGAPFETYWKLDDLAEGAFRAGIVDAPPPASKAIANRVAAGASAVAGTAAAVQPVVQALSAQQTNTPKLQAVLVALAILLALVAAFLPHRSQQ